MFDFYQKRKIRTILNSRFTQGFIIFLALLVAWSAFVRFEIAIEMKDRRETAEGQTEVLKERKEQLEEKVEYLSNERGIEAELRRQFDVTLEGEQVIVIVDDEKNNEIKPLSTSTNDREDKKWYQFWR